MLNTVLDVLIGIVALAWIFDVLKKVSSDLIAWIYALITYGIYLLLAVVVCGYSELATFLWPAPLFVAMAISQASRPGIGGVRKEGIGKSTRDDSLGRMTREFREAMRQLESNRKPPDSVNIKHMSKEWNWLHGARTDQSPRH
jgi:hypothetical protein